MPEPRERRVRAFRSPRAALCLPARRPRAILFLKQAATVPSATPACSAVSRYGRLTHLRIGSRSARSSPSPYSAARVGPGVPWRAAVPRRAPAARAPPGAHYRRGRRSRCRRVRRTVAWWGRIVGANNSSLARRSAAGSWLFHRLELVDHHADGLFLRCRFSSTRYRSVPLGPFHVSAPSKRATSCKLHHSARGRPTASRCEQGEIGFEVRHGSVSSFEYYAMFINDEQVIIAERTFLFQLPGGLRRRLQQSASRSKTRAVCRQL